MAIKKKRKKRYKNKKNNHIKYIVLLIILICLIVYTTTKIVSLEKYANYYQINNNTSKYISYPYKENDTIELKTKILNTNNKNKSNYYSYQINNNTNNDIEYQIILTPINMEETDDLYVYITDNKNNKITDIMKYDELENDSNNKILYNGKLKKDATSKQRLRIWSNKKNKKISFKISTKIK